MNKVMTTLFLSTLLALQIVAIPAQAQSAAAEKISAALQRALERSDYAQKKRLAELQDVADSGWTGFRLVGTDGKLHLDTSTAQNAQAKGHNHSEEALSCSMCGSHLFDGEHRLAQDTEDLLFARPTSSFAVVTDLHSQWSAGEGKIELKCGFCGAHLGFVDPGDGPSTPLRFAVEPGKLKGADAP